jgi:hypothetical protein
MTLLASGGYSRMVFGPDPPYNFQQSLLNGGLGIRAFVSRHVAVRGDVRAQYTPKNPFFSDLWTGQVQASLGASWLPFAAKARVHHELPVVSGAQGGFSCPRPTSSRMPTTRSSVATG